MGFTELDRRQGLAAARVDGAADRLTLGADKDWPRDKKIAHLRSISGDPIVLGHAAGRFLYMAEDLHPSYAEVADLIMECGGDEQTAQNMLEWNRDRAAGQRAAAEQLRAEGGSQFQVPGQAGS